MAGDFLFTAAIFALAIYGVWSIRRDLRRGVASARGFSFAKVTQPKRYRWLMGFNIFAVSLICIGAIIQLAEAIGKS
ncbi:hypothetical protein [Sphingomonas echinoides]|uniref:Uncharacterized protein n=1 Tax=Sphingomonas echinoides TaxID=59803 RepID=A0ABU4PNH8_9SPHN|nr:hypothetical protein [Sphingomonas echinoides]MDX5985686.1 hypothetical protein [Sphingomonas echinoides]